MITLENEGRINTLLKTELGSIYSSIAFRKSIIREAKERIIIFTENISKEHHKIREEETKIKTMEKEKQDIVDILKERGIDNE